ncbi:MAG: hypothetical protein ACAH59_13810 [Pseudobdellovibrionaceae bacterium]
MKKTLFILIFSLVLQILSSTAVAKPLTCQVLFHSQGASLKSPLLFHSTQPSLLLFSLFEGADGSQNYRRSELISQNYLSTFYIHRQDPRCEVKNTFTTDGNFNFHCENVRGFARVEGQLQWTASQSHGTYTESAWIHPESQAENLLLIFADCKSDSNPHH